MEKGAIIEFHTDKFEVGQGSIIGQYLTTGASGGGTETIFYVVDNDNNLRHVPAFRVSKIIFMPSDESFAEEEDFVHVGQIKWVDVDKEVEKKGRQELYEETIRQYLEKETSLVTDAEGKKYLVFDLVDVSEENRKAYISDISREIVEYFD